jgi:hypothetical protein
MKPRKGIIPPEVFRQLESIQKSLARHQERARGLDRELKSLDHAIAKETVAAWHVEFRDDLQPQIRFVANCLRQIALDNSRPPFEAEYLLYLILGKEERAAVIGDLAEEYRHILRQFGRRRANIWFYKQVTFSIWPFVKRVLARVVTLLWLSRFIH